MDQNNAEFSWNDRLNFLYKNNNVLCLPFCEANAYRNVTIYELSQRIRFLRPVYCIWIWETRGLILWSLIISKVISKAKCAKQWGLHWRYFHCVYYLLLQNNTLFKSHDILITKIISLRFSWFSIMFITWWLVGSPSFVTSGLIFNAD